jgi:Uma2 family endonuclease
MSAIRVPRLTPSQYLEIERAAETKSEYFEGEMFAMSGGLLSHALISTALLRELDASLDGRKCSTAGSDLRVGVSKQGPFFYPDVSVHCGDAELADDWKDTLLNPILIIEVLSPPSEAFDRGKKFAAYRRIPALREYVLVSQTEPSVEVYSKGPAEAWTFIEFTGLESVCALPSLGLEIPLAAIYRRVPLETPPGAASA